jgi:hypothetical protein
MTKSKYDRGQQPKNQDNQCHFEDAAGRLGSAATESSFTGNDENSASDLHSSWGNIDEPFTDEEADIGGILSQLRELQAAHLAYVKAHEERLERRLQENQKHQRKILNDMQKLEERIQRLMNNPENSTL